MFYSPAIAHSTARYNDGAGLDSILGSSPVGVFFSEAGFFFSRAFVAAGAAFTSLPTSFWARDAFCFAPAGLSESDFESLSFRDSN
jgi:hypothetical protein